MATRHSYTIRVDRGDIDGAAVESAFNCMVARAINRAEVFTTPARVFRDHMELGEVRIDWPRWIRRRIHAFDQWQNVAPFQFGLLVECDPKGRVIDAVVDSPWQRLKMLLSGWLPMPQPTAAIDDSLCNGGEFSDMLNHYAEQQRQLQRQQQTALATTPRPQPQPAALPQPIIVEVLDDSGAWINVADLYRNEVRNVR